MTIRDALELVLVFVGTAIGLLVCALLAAILTDTYYEIMDKRRKL